MKVAIVGKSAFSLPAKGKPSQRTPIVLAGHTIQLIRPLALAMLKRGWRVAHIFPDTLGPEESAITDEFDTCPTGLAMFAYATGPLPKSVHDVASVALNAAILRASTQLGGLDWCLFVNPFPQLLMAQPALRRMKDGGSLPFVAALLRGGDGYKWTDAAYVEQIIGDSEQAHEVVEWYKDVLREVDLRFCASRWQRTMLDRRGLGVDGILPSPPAPISALDPIDCKKLLEQLLKPIWGTLDPSLSWLSLVGRIHPDKAPSLALSAFSQAGLDGWQIVVAGSGDATAIEEMVKRAPDDVRRRMAVISVPPRLLPELYGASEAFIHTSLPSNHFVDARPSSLTSACFAGKPVVAILSGGVAECISDANLAALCLPYDDSYSQADLERTLAERLAALQDTTLVLRICAANWAHARTNKADLTLNSLLDQLARFDVVHARMDTNE